MNNSGLLTMHKKLDSFQVSAIWEKSDQLWIDGQYHTAVSMRKNLMEELYELNGVRGDNYFPPNLSIGFLGPIGHQAMLGVHIAAQRLGVIPRGTRSAARVLKEEPKPLLDVFSNELIYTNYASAPAWTELPNHWHAAERLQLVRAQEGFLDLYQLIESVFSKADSMPTNPLFEVSEAYLDKCNFEFRELGLKGDSWFVGLHIRNEGNNLARRNQPIESYISSIKEITSRGGWVIRIGDSTMEPLPKLPRVIDLVAHEDSRKDLHLYVLSQCKFFMGTSSGPSSVPPLFGVPTLVTNTTSIGRNVLSAAANSMYVPKIHTDLNGKIKSLSEILQGPDAFGELELPKLKELGLDLKPNSEDEIHAAVCEMFDNLAGIKNRHESEFLAQVANIRSKSPWTSQGNFATSFLEKYQERFIS